MSAEPVGPIGPGDLVEHYGPCALGVEMPLGTIVRVEGLTVHDCICHGCHESKRGLLLSGWDNGAPYSGRYGWSACAFRPISRRSDFERFLTEVSAPRDDVGESADQPAKREPEPAR